MVEKEKDHRNKVTYLTTYVWGTVSGLGMKTRCLPETVGR